MSELLEAALRYMPRTIPIVAGDKRPAVDDWPHWASTRTSVAAHYAAHPDDGVGIRTGGRRTVLAVLDVDTRDGGDVALAELERQHGRLPATPTVVTGSGGRHHYFRAPHGLRSRNLRAIGIDGLELKAAGCQVVAPPSLHPVTGRLYVWDPGHPLIEREIAPLPGWVAQLAGHQTVKPSASDVSGLAERDPLHAIPSTIYVPKLTGRPLTHGGFIHCPFHKDGQERRPALKVYDGGGWKCHACGAAGRIYQLAGLLGGWTLPLTRVARRAVRAELIAIFAAELAA